MTRGDDGCRTAQPDVAQRVHGGARLPKSLEQAPRRRHRELDVQERGALAASRHRDEGPLDAAEETAADDVQDFHGFRRSAMGPRPHRLA